MLQNKFVENGKKWNFAFLNTFYSTLQILNILTYQGIHKSFFFKHSQMPSKNILNVKK